MNPEVKPIKIALVGTLSSGKTTLWRTLQTRYREDHAVVFVPEAAREFFKQNPDIPENTRQGFEVQEKIQGIVLEFEQRAHSHHPKVLICDRSVLDACVYTGHYGDVVGSLHLLERIRFWLPTYTKLFLLDPSGIPYSKDAERKEDEITRNRIHLEYLDFFTNHHLPYALLSGNLEERINRVDQLLLRCYT